MQISASYKTIWTIAYPIMVGSLSQNLIGLTDIVFLGRVGEVELGAASFIAIYYLVLVMMGFGISRAGQIFMARRAGEGNYERIGAIFYNLMYAELFAALIFWLFMQLVSPWLLQYFIVNPDIYTASTTYLHYRSFGIFFSLFGFALMSLYTAIGRSRPIAVITIVLFLVNTVLNYGLIFGKFGLPAMGIGGSGLASSLAEVFSAIIGVAYLLFDKNLQRYSVRHFHRPEKALLRRIGDLSLPTMLQYFIGFGGWFLLFSFIESLGKQALAISSVLKNVYSFYSVPAWGFASACNAMVSNLIGQRKYKQVFVAVNRTAIFSFVMTIALCISLAIMPYTILSIFTNNQAVIDGAIPILYMLLGIILAGSVSTVIFNGLLGTGSIFLALGFEIAAVAVYLIYAYSVTYVFPQELPHIWASEFIYWVVLAVPSWAYLQSQRWQKVTV